MIQHKQRGISMIELLITLAISSVLILGVTQIYVDNRSNYLFQQGQAENTENGRYALLVLERQLAKTGYRRSPDDSFEFAFPAASQSGCGFAAGQTIVWDNANNALCLRYQPRDNDDLSCDYKKPSDQAPSLTGLDEPYKPYSHSIVERITLADGALTCNGAALVTGVSAMRFDFGVGPVGVRSVTEYTTSPDKPIRNLRYSLLMASERGNRQGMSSAAFKEWNNTDPTDNRLYYTVSSSMTLRNLMP